MRVTYMWKPMKDDERWDLRWEKENYDNRWDNQLNSEHIHLIDTGMELFLKTELTKSRRSLNWPPVPEPIPVI